MSATAFIKQCLANGMPLEMVLQAASVHEAECARAVDEALAARRAKDVERQAKHRQKKRNVSHVTTQDVTLVTLQPELSRDLAGEPARVVIPTSSLRSEVIPPEKPTVSTPKGDTDRRGARLPDDWTPPDGLNAQDFGVTHEQYADQLQRFRDYWRGVPGAKGRKADWPATWRNWIRRAADDLTKSGPHDRNHHNANNRAAGRGVWAEIIAERDGPPARDLARTG